MSGTTFFTLGLGDLQPAGRLARAVTVAEAGTGFAFLAIVIAYFPVLYQSFSRREVQLTLLDAWAGSPPAAAEVLRRLAARNEMTALQTFLKDWEYWCSEVLESHISYPALAYFRSQHARQSWRAAGVEDGQMKEPMVFQEDRPLAAGERVLHPHQLPLELSKVVG